MIKSDKMVRAATIANMQTLSLVTPAKLNRFLHIVGRRTDGYHELQTIFQLVDYCDTLHFNVRSDNKITLAVQKDPEAVVYQPSLAANNHNLVLRAANLLQHSNVQRLGVDITLLKRIPLGGGMGGGSSDAAATLLALNKLWNLNLSIQELVYLGQQLGADVPCFIRGRSAWGEGIGEQLTTLDLPKRYFLVLVPPVQISTIEIFCDEQLTQTTPKCKIALSLLESGHNDCEAVVRRLHPEVGAALNWLRQFTAAHLTGTGCCSFAAFADKSTAQTIAQQVPSHWEHFITAGLNVSPVQQQLAALSGRHPV